MICVFRRLSVPYNPVWNSPDPESWELYFIKCIQEWTFTPEYSIMSAEIKTENIFQTGGHRGFGNHAVPDCFSGIPTTKTGGSKQMSSGFISALMRQRRNAKKAEPDTNGRLREILGIIRKYDYTDGITPDIVVKILQDLGPTFVKIGQIASQQAEYIPEDYCDALVKLRSKVAPMEIGVVYEQIEKYLGKPVNELFASFSEKPLGSASIGQVHKAELSDGTVVAVKVRRPGVVDTVARDFALIEKVLDTFVKGDLGGIDVKSMILELEQTSKRELDFTNEADYLQRFYENNTGREGIVVPRVYQELTCEAVLTEDFAVGREVSDRDFLATLSEEERERLAGLIADNFAEQVLTDGFYHADPHSGNVFIRSAGPRTAREEPETSHAAEGTAEKAGTESKKEKKLPLPDHDIEWIDFGMMGTLGQKQRQLLIDMITEVVMHDAYGLKRTVLQVAQPNGEIDHGYILGMCEDMCSQFNGSDFGEFDLGSLMNTILDGLQEASFKVDPFLTNLSRGIIAMEGTIRTLSPKVNILNHFMDKVDLSMNFNLNLENPGEMNPEIALKLLQLFKGVTDSSTKTAETLDMLEKGQIRVRTDFSFEEKALGSVGRFVTYTVRALMIIALFLGSCLLFSASANTPVNSTITTVFRAMGFTGYAVSIFFAYCLYRNMKKGK